MRVFFIFMRTFAIFIFFYNFFSIFKDIFYILFYINTCTNIYICFFTSCTISWVIVNIISCYFSVCFFFTFFSCLFTYSILLSFALISSYKIFINAFSFSLSKSSKPRIKSRIIFNIFICFWNRQGILGKLDIVELQELMILKHNYSCQGIF